MVSLLTAIGVSMIAVATISDSYLPLFLAWLPFGAVPLILSRADRMSVEPRTLGESEGSASTE